MKVWYDQGIHLVLDNKHLLLDPFGNPMDNVDAVLVSHAHWDHASGLDKMHGKVMLMHPATYDYKQQNIARSNQVKTISFGDKITIAGLTVEGYRSAHCVGSLQFRIVGREKTVIFTGDLNLKGTYTEAPTEPLKGDALIIESNYGHPKYVFPDRLASFNKLGEWIHRYVKEKTIALFSHALGKAQELTQYLIDLKLLRNGGNGERCNLFMDRLNVKTNQLFEKYRYRFSNRYRLLSKGIELGAGEFALFPIRDAPSLKQINDIKKSFNIDDGAFGYVSGWVLGKRGSFYFPISSHSGYDELVTYVKESEASEVYTFHGFTETFSSRLKGMGIDATPITPESVHASEEVA